MKPLFVKEHEIDSFIDKKNSEGERLWFWNANDLFVFTPDQRARSSMKGSMIRGRWGFTHQIPFTHSRKWVIERKYL